MKTLKQSVAVTLSTLEFLVSNGIMEPAQAVRIANECGVICLDPNEEEEMEVPMESDRLKKLREIRWLGLTEDNARLDKEIARLSSEEDDDDEPDLSTMAGRKAKWLSMGGEE